MFAWLSNSDRGSGDASDGSSAELSELSAKTFVVRYELGCLPSVDETTGEIFHSRFLLQIRCKACFVVSVTSRMVVGKETVVEAAFACFCLREVAVAIILSSLALAAETVLVVGTEGTGTCWFWSLASRALI